MHVKRFLGAAWATVHGPADPLRAMTWTLDAGFAGWLVGPTPRSVDWSAVQAAAAKLPFGFPAVRAGSVFAERPATAGLASAQDGERAAAQRAVDQAAALAHRLGCATLVVEPGLVPVPGDVRDEDLGDSRHAWTKAEVDALLARRKAARNAALDRVCRAVHELVRRHPDLQVCLTGGRSLLGVADLPTLDDLFEDLRQVRLGYWHDAAVAARRHQVLGEAQGEWLEKFGNRLRGMVLSDASSDGMYLPPGMGGVDYGLLASYVPRSGAPLPVVLELDPSVPPGELAGIRSCLQKHGL